MTTKSTQTEQLQALEGLLTAALELVAELTTPNGAVAPTTTKGPRKQGRHRAGSTNGELPDALKLDDDEKLTSAEAAQALADEMHKPSTDPKARTKRLKQGESHNLPLIDGSQIVLKTPLKTRAGNIVAAAGTYDIVAVQRYKEYGDNVPNETFSYTIWSDSHYAGPIHCGFNPRKTDRTPGGFPLNIDGWGWYGTDWGPAEDNDDA